MTKNLVFLVVSVVAIFGIVLQLLPQPTGNLAIDPLRCVRLAQDFRYNLMEPSFERGNIEPALATRLNPCTQTDMSGNERFYDKQMPQRDHYEIEFLNGDIYGYIGSPELFGGNIQYVLCKNPDGSLKGAVTMSGILVC